ncbi:MAG: hypothetical protein Q9203_004407 [Teloschistes exilis]
MFILISPSNRNSGTISSAVRFVTFYEADMSSDTIRYNEMGFAWACVELGVYFIAATLLSLRHLLLKICKKTQVVDSTPVPHDSFVMPTSKGDTISNAFSTHGSPPLAGANQMFWARTAQRWE